MKGNTGEEQRDRVGREREEWGGIREGRLRRIGEVSGQMVKIFNPGKELGWACRPSGSC